jgi:hypothetical protein
MNKFQYYVKRPNTNPYNYVHSGYTGYTHPYKKNNFKMRTKSNNNQNNNKYFENRNKKYYYNNNFNGSFNNNFINSNESQNYHSSVFQKKNYWHRYTPHFTEENKIAEEINNDSINEEEKKEEILKIRVNVSDTQCKELVLCKNDDISEKVKEFCKDNGINDKLVEPLINKVNQSLFTLEIINNNMVLNKNNYLILDKIKNFMDNNNNEKK